MSETNFDRSSVIDDLRKVISPDNLSTEASTLEVLSTDFSEQNLSKAIAAISPKSVEEVQKALEVAHAHNVPVVSRGGGMSYTLAAVPMYPSIILDLSSLNRIIEINEKDLYVLVETGVTWEQLYKAFLDKDVHIPFVGTYSGAVATIGGGLGNMATGTGKGTVAEDLLGLEIVTPDGRVLKTGALSTGNPSASRYFAPDLSGIFIHDAGVFGVKTKACFRLRPKPRASAFASFGFSDDLAATRAMVEIARAGLATEIRTMGRFHPVASANQSPSRDEKRAFLASVHRLFPNKFLGWRQLSRIFRPNLLKRLARWERSLNIVVDGFDYRSAEKAMKTLRKIARKHNGTEIPPLLAFGQRARPFYKIEQLMIGKDPMCIVPTNMAVPLSKAEQLVKRLNSFFADLKPKMQELGLSHTLIFPVINGEVFGAEAILFWKDKLNPLRLSVASEERKPELAAIPANPESREFALTLRKRLVKLGEEEFHSGHFQSGKYYPVKPLMTRPENWAAIEHIKEWMDPKGILNPGGLGLDSWEN